MSRDELAEIVMTIIQEYRSGKQRPAPSSKLVQDLKLASDDATAIIVRLERRFGVKGSLEEWGRVSRIDDVVDLLSLLIERKRRDAE